MTKKEKIVNEILENSENNSILDKKFFDIVDNYKVSDKMLQEVINEIDKLGVAISSAEINEDADVEEDNLDIELTGKSSSKVKKTSASSVKKESKKKSDTKSTTRKELNFKIVEHIGVLSESTKGWKKELNIVSWNDAPAKYDLREWSPDHDRMGKGVTLTNDEFVELNKIMNKYIK